MANWQLSSAVIGPKRRNWKSVWRWWWEWRCREGYEGVEYSPGAILSAFRLAGIRIYRREINPHRFPGTPPPLLSTAADSSRNISNDIVRRVRVLYLTSLHINENVRCTGTDEEVPNGYRFSGPPRVPFAHERGYVNVTYVFYIGNRKAKRNAK